MKKRRTVDEWVEYAEKMAAANVDGKIESSERVNKHTRAGRDGKEVICPECFTSAKVYHFAFCACTCQGCGEMIDKYDFLVVNKKPQRKKAL